MKLKINLWSTGVIMITALFAFHLFSCHRSSSGGGSTGGAPNLSNPDFPATIDRGSAYDFKCDYSDPEGDIQTVYLKDNWSGGSYSDSITAAEAGISGTSGTAKVEFTIPEYTPVGDHTFEVWVTDAGNNTSNKLSGVISVR